MIFGLPVLIVLHGVAAAFYGLLAILILLRQRNPGQEGASARAAAPGRTGLWLAAACLITALWALTVALSWDTPLAGLANLLDVGRAVGWYGFLLHLYRRTLPQERRSARMFTAMGALALAFLLGLSLLDRLGHVSASWWWLGSVGARLALSVSSVLLIENLYFNATEDARWHLNLLCVAIGGLALYDLMLYSDALLFRRVSLALFEGRASAFAMAAPLIAVAAVRNRRWAIDIHVSREAVFRSATLLISGLFLMGLAVTGEIFRRGGSEWGLVAEVSLVFAGVLTIAVLLTSGSARSRMRAVLVDNFFSHRFDYRQQWMRCVETLSAPESYVPLPMRAIRAAAAIVDSPAGMLFLRAPEEVAFAWAGSWNMPAGMEPVPPGHALIGAFRDGDWIVDVAAEPGLLAGLGAVPRAWLAVPLRHLGQLAGFVLLARPRAPFRLDREVYDLLRIVAAEIASRVAEQRASQELSQSRDLRAYNARFAFVIHDIKNVSGQLSMLLANAETHAANPEFQRDMLATVRASVAKITRLLARLAANEAPRRAALISPAERIGAIVEARRPLLGARLVVEGDGGDAAIGMDADQFDAVINHLLDNALEASAAGETVRIALRQDGLRVEIAVIDRGRGMDAEFVREDLFRPFRSTKQGGHGIGAFQARALLRAAGGDLLVASLPGEGTTMRVVLPCLRVADAAVPAVG